MRSILENGNLGLKKGVVKAARPRTTNTRECPPPPPRGVCVCVRVRVAGGGGGEKYSMVGNHVCHHKVKSFQNRPKFT